MSDGTARAEDVEVGKTAAAGDECRVADGPPANVRLPQGTADVPPASSRGVSPRVGPGGETPPELAGADACGTPAAARPLRPTNARWPHAGPFSWRTGSPPVGGYRIAVVAALGLGWLWFGGQVVGSACREFHLDEGWELTKAWMLQRGFSLYGEFWNDQPPLHTWVLSGLLAVPGAGTGLARGVSLGMATLLMGCVAWLVARMAGFWGGVVAVVLVAGSAQVLLQCGAVMIGLPAYALGLASVVCAWRWRETGRGSLAVLSGVMAGLALQTKLTAGLVIGALVVQVLVWGWQAGAGEPRRAWARAVAGWVAGGVGAWGMVWARFPAMGAGLLVGGHFDEANAGAFAEERYMQLDAMLRADWPLWWWVIPGLWWCWVKRREGGIFPLVLLVGSYAAHRLHRPFWFYYYLHLAVPLAWVSAVGVVRGGQWVVTRWAAADAVAGARWVTRAAAVAWCVGVGAMAMAVPERLVREAAFAGRESPPEVEELIGKLRARGAETQWFYTDRPTYAFAARLVMPPELVVVPQKRVRTGRMTEAELVALLRRYRPEQMVLCGRELRGPGFAEWVAGGYRCEWRTEAFEYFVRKDLGATTGGGG